MKTAEEFYRLYSGKKIDDDGVYGAQCVDGFRVFCRWAGIQPYPTPNGWADGYWYGRASHPEFEPITGYQNFRNGDWVIWARHSGSHPSSHIAMWYNGMEFGENQGGNGGFTIKATIFSDALGALRWKGFNVSEHGNDLEQINAKGTAVSTREISTAFIIYAKTGTKPQMTLTTSEYEGAKIYAVQIKVDSNINVATSYCPDTEWLCKMQSDYMLSHGWYEIACCNAGYFEMSGNVGKPVGAVMVDWTGKWSEWHGTPCVPAAGNGYPTLAWNDGTMTLLDKNASDIDLKAYHWLQGVGQSLVIDGKVNCSVGSNNGRYNTANNATAIGYNATTKILTLFANVQNGTNAGTLNTLQRAYVAESLGCQIAVQLDGGGSTQLEWLASALSTPEPVTPTPTPTDGKDAEIAKLQKQVDDLNSQIAGLQSKLDIIKKVVG